jgi:threonine dehydrogenase-like Zn-dependent dehydrogenase
VRAAVLREGKLVVRDDVPEPRPGFGQVLVGVKACGICGSDLHFVEHGRELLRLAETMEGMPDMGSPRTDLSRDVYMGHELAAEVIEAGPGTVAPPAGTLVTSIPVMIGPGGIEPIVYSNALPAGYGERMLLSAPLVQEVPNGLDARRAALTEPMAVGLHAVNRSGIGPRDGALVLGCGPVGVAVIAALRRRGVETVVASDPSGTRRALALKMGASHACDPREARWFEAWGEHGGGRPLVVFEAIGTAGILDEVMRCAPPQTRVVVVGVCMGADSITPFFGITKEIQLQFVLGYDPQEFSDSLRAIAEGEVDVEPLITGEVPLDGVPAAFDDLADPERHCKILVLP